MYRLQVPTGPRATGWKTLLYMTANSPTPTASPQHVINFLYIYFLSSFITSI
jgi:hypothetical protein